MFPSMDVEMNIINDYSVEFTQNREGIVMVALSFVEVGVVVAMFFP